MQGDGTVSVAEAIERLESTSSALIEAKRNYALARNKFEQHELNMQVVFRTSEDWMAAKNDTIRKAEAANILNNTDDHKNLKDDLDKATVDLQVAQIRYDVAKEILGLLKSSLGEG